ncbi:hypothetical protein B5C34_12855 [Pacificimonas flava]|uniref:DarT domain-containing protein n=2 Tax=Pacificimonas TaxID=1960290 RepID=A0A219B8Y1_9SPHN|nr:MULTISPECIES: DarT ssDNA thymidine ADP-ribosyltransferase family protein [Pacificimonas]MBZ6378442.1 DUF4433 domain-containing protein [Pacificimonas aurantium]OWV34259.1 hypothetical protein B5C34_12855 [Pacificimonas flava]
MGISQNSALSHIRAWKKRFSHSSYRYRTNWPSRLFRHDPLENVAKILQAGEIRGRNIAGQDIEKDVASQEVLSTNRDPYDYVRLYFRPKTPTQYRIEGCRKPQEELGWPHSPTLGIFLLDSTKVLTRSDCYFSDGNTQNSDTVIYNDESGFEKIDFDKVYHEGGFGTSNPDNSDIIRKRCAEVLVPDRLELSHCLQAVICRSHAERSYLLHLLGSDSSKWSSRIKVFSKPGMFESRFSYVESVDIHQGGLNIDFHPRRDGQKLRTEVFCQGVGDHLPSFRWEEEDRNVSVRLYTAPLVPGTFLVTIKLEGEVVFVSQMELVTHPV